MVRLACKYPVNAGLAVIAVHAGYVFRCMVPTLPMFAAFPFLLGWPGSRPASGASVRLTFAGFALAVRPFGIRSW